MSVLSRSIPLVALVCSFGASALSAQDLYRNENFRWSVGAQAGVFIYKTPTQSRGGTKMVGVHTLIKAKRTGLLLSVDEVLGDSQTSSFSSTTAPGGTEQVTFNDIRRYSALLMAFPFRGAMQPFLGVGLGIQHVINPQSTSGSDAATQLGSTGYGTVVGGLQFIVGGITAFGQYQFTTAGRTKSVSTGANSSATGRLIDGPVHSIVGGLRISLGSSRESITGN